MRSRFDGEHRGEETTAAQREKDLWLQRQREKKESIDVDESIGLYLLSNSENPLGVMAKLNIPQIFQAPSFAF